MASNWLEAHSHSWMPCQESFFNNIAFDMDFNSCHLTGILSWLPYPFCSHSSCRSAAPLLGLLITKDTTVSALSWIDKLSREKLKARLSTLRLCGLTSLGFVMTTSGPSKAPSGSDSVDKLKKEKESGLLTLLTLMLILIRWTQWG